MLAELKDKYGADARVVWAKDKHGEIGKRPTDEGFWHEDWGGMLRRLEEYRAAFLGKAKARGMK